ncbi:MAG: hypothetical protein ACFCVC_16305 [Acidimicrobiia bacterium]
MTAQTSGLADVVLEDPIGGDSIPFGDLAADPLTVILVRYFGCLPCQAFLAEVDQRVGDVPGSVVAVGGSADYQARWLREKKGVMLPMLLDGPQVIRTTLEITDLSTGEMSAGRGWASYGKALLSGFRPQKPTRDARRAPGVAVFGPDLDLRWLHRGDTLGDYPSVEELIEAVSSVR